MRKALQGYLALSSRHSLEPSWFGDVHRSLRLTLKSPSGPRRSSLYFSEGKHVVWTSINDGVSEAPAAKDKGRKLFAEGNKQHSNIQH